MLMPHFTVTVCLRKSYLKKTPLLQVNHRENVRTTDTCLQMCNRNVIQDAFAQIITICRLICLFAPLLFTKKNKKIIETEIFLSAGNVGQSAHRQNERWGLSSSQTSHCVTSERSIDAETTFKRRCVSTGISWIAISTNRRGQLSSRRML